MSDLLRPEPEAEGPLGHVSRRNALKLFANSGVALGGGSALMALLSACGSESGGSATSGGGGGGGGGATSFSSTQRGALAVAFDPFDPAVTTNGATININFYVYEALYRARLDDPTAFVPQLAAGEPEKVDDKTYRVTIRDGAAFSTGDPVTADDVVYSFNRIKKLGASSFYGAYMVNIAGMRASAPDTVEVKLRSPMALIKERLAVIKVLSRRAVEADRAAVEYKPIGSGPYALVAANSSREARLELNASYNGPDKAKFVAKAIDFSSVTDPAAQLTGLQGNRFDAIGQVLLSSVATLKRSGKYEVSVLSGHAIHGFVFNAGSRPFNDVRVRKAIMYGLDRDAIAQGAYFGNVVPATALVPRENADYTAPSTVYDYDPEKARSLLAEAGYKDGLSYELMVGSNFAGMTDAAQLMQQQLADIGVTMTIRSGDLFALYSYITANRYECLYGPNEPAILGSADAEFVYRFLYYGAFPTQYMYWKDPAQREVEKLLDKSVASATLEEYKANIAKVIDLAADQGPYQPVMMVANPVAWNPKTCSGITPSHMGHLYFGKDL